MSRHTFSRDTRCASTSRQRPITLLALAAAAAAASLYAPTPARATDGIWTGTTAGTFNYSDTTQWAAGTVADGTGAIADFSTVDPLGDITVTLDAAHTLGSLSFADADPSTPASWIVTGTNALTLSTGTTAVPTITVGTLGTGKSVTISAPITAASGFTKAGTGTLVINNSANAPGAITVAAGTLNGGDSGAGLGTGAITLQGTATLGAPTNNNNTWTMANPVVVDASATGATFNSSNRLRMNGAVSGSGTLSFNVVSTVSRMDLQNDWTGFTGNLNFIGSGTVRLGINALASGQPKFNAAGWANTKLDLGGSVSLSPNTNSGGNTIAIGALSGSSATAQLGAHSAGGAATWSVGGLGTNTTFAGGVRGSENFTKVGTGTLVLTNNTGILDTTGNFTASAGTLQIDGNKSGAGNTVVNSGGTLAGNGTVAGLITVNSGGHIAPGSATSVGTLTLSSLTLNAGSFIDTEFSATGNDSVISTGTLTINGGAVNLFNQGGTTPYSTNGTYNLITFNAMGGLGVGGLGVANPQSGKVYTFGTAGNVVTLAISSAGGPVYWNNASGGTWAANGNWTSPFPNGQGAFAGFGGGGTALAADSTVTLDGDKTVGTLSLNSAHSFTIAQGTGGSLTLDNGSTNAAITDAAGSHTVSAPVNLSTVGNDVNVVAAADSLTLSGALNGSGALNKVGAGTLVLPTANPSFTGAFNPSAGTTQIASANALQSATLNGGAGTLTTSLPSLNIGHLGAGTITFGSAVQIPVGTDGSDSTFAGALAGPATLVKNGAGTLTLNGASAQTGGLTINGGRVTVNAVQSYTGDTLVNNGSTLGITGAGGLNVASTIRLSNGSTLSLDQTGTPSTFLSNPVVVAAGATANVYSGALGNGFGGAFSSDDANSVLVVGGNTSFSASGTNKQFTGFSGTVQVASGSTLRFSATSLNNGGDNTTFEVHGLLQTRNNGTVSLGALTGDGTLGGGQAATYAGTITYAIGAKGTNTTFTGAINEKDSSHPNAITKVGTGTLTLAGSGSYTGATTVNAGTLQLASDTALPSASPVVINTGGTLDLNAHNQTSPSLAGTGGNLLLSANLSLNGSTDTSFAGSIVGTGTLSKDGSAVQIIGSVDAPNVTVNAGRLGLAGTTASRISNLTVSAAPLQLNARLVLPTMSQSDATTLVLMGRNTGAWDGLAGITTTADAHHGIAITSVATLGTAAFPNLSGLTGSETLLVGTYYGDLNLDGRVNGDDYTLMDRGAANHLTGWTNGDLNYDGAIDAGDYFLMDSTYGAAGVTHDAWTALLSERQSEFGDAYVSSLIASVPEPTTLSLLGLAALPLLSRRRRTAR